MRLILIFLIFLTGHDLMGQPQADFIIPSNACLQETIKIENLSVNASQYVWDFCGGDLIQQPTANLLTSSYGGYGTRVEMTESAGEFFGFFLSGGTRALFKLSFGSNINSIPVLTNLGDLGLNSNQLRAIDIVSENGLYFGFIIDSDKNKLYRIDFGSSLSNNPLNAVEVFSGLPLNVPFQLSSVSEGTLKYLFLTNQGDGKLVRLKFDNSYSGTVAESYSIPIFSNWLNAISFLKADNRWHCITGSPLTTDVLKVDFVNGLDDNSPLVTTIPVPSNPMGIELVNENGAYYAFVQTRNSTLSVFRLDFGASLNNLPLAITEIKNIGYENSEVWNFAMFNSKSSWVAFATESTGSNIFRLKFPNNCFSDVEYSSETKPVVSTSKTGAFVLSLTAKDVNGNYSYASKTLQVLNKLSSDIVFSYQNMCVNNDVNFTSTNNSGDVIGYNWSFGDGNTSINSTPGHQYSSGGIYPVQLIVEATNGCKNFIEKIVKIYNQPLASFALPLGLICTNNEFTFLNNTIDNFDGNLTYQWYVDNSPNVATRDLKYIFSSTGNKDIKLKSSIPGCFSESSQTFIVLQQGSLVNFSSAPTGCQATPLAFTNTTSGTVTAYSWNFGDGNTSSSQNPSNIFTNLGSFSITLQANNAAGCQNSKTKDVIIYSKPQPNFSIGLPPFSCTGSPSQFTDLTPVPTDSNITGWTWIFGDATNGTSILKNPTYTYSTASNYNVSLTVISNFGCINTIQKPVTIAQSPVSAFINTPACINQGTQFTDASTGNIKSRLWQVQSNTFATPVVQYMFGSSGTFPVSLIITGNNSCVSQFTKNMIIPVIPTLDFSVLAPCANNQSTFSEITSGSDQAVTEIWNFGNLANGAGSPVQYAFTIPGIYSVRLSSTRQSGCVYSLTKNVSISQSPVADFTPSALAGAAPLAISFTNASSGASTYLWKFMDQNNSTSTQVSPSFVFTDLGDYSVELNAFNGLGCANRTNKVIRVLIPKIDAVMNDFYFVKDDATGTLQAVVSVLNKSNLPIIDPSILLDFSDGALVKKKIKGTIQPDQVLTEMLDFQLVPRSAKYACAEVSVLDDINSFDNKKCLTLSREEILFSPYPNPAQAELKMDWVSVDGGQVTILITNSTGAIAYKQVLDSVIIGLNRLIINTSELSSGIFFIRFSDNSTTQSFSFAVSGN